MSSVRPSLPLAMAQLQLDWNQNPKVYVGNLGEGTTKEDLVEVFERYGKVTSVNGTL